jgi:lysophospholipase L1-like esterase
MIAVRVLIALVALAMLAALAGCGSEPEPGRTAIVGDSFTTGTGVAPAESYVAHLEAMDPGADVVPIARDGATVRRWILRNTELTNRLRAAWPSTVVVALGGNEFYIGRPPTMYGEQLVDLAGIIRAAVPEADLVFVHYYEIGARDLSACDIEPCARLGTVVHVGGKPAGSLGGPPVESGVPAPWRDYGAFMQIAAERAGARYVDLSTAAPWKSYLGNDGIHLTPAGHRRYADELAEVIGVPS